MSSKTGLTNRRTRNSKFLPIAVGSRGRVIGDAFGRRHVQYLQRSRRQITDTAELVDGATHCNNRAAAARIQNPGVLAIDGYDLNLIGETDHKAKSAVNQEWFSPMKAPF